MALLISYLVALLALFQQAWFIAAHDDVCETSTETRLILAGTTVSDYGSFTSSLNNVYSTPKVDVTVIVWSTIMTYSSTMTFPGYGIYDSKALASAGYSSFTSETTTITRCPEPEMTGEVPPSSSVGSTCSPDGDHSDCPPSGTGDHVHSESAATCSPHHDHWHCPPGVASPTTPPSPEDTGKPSVEASGTCSPHHDHWHCPDGVLAPTTPPAPSDFSAAGSTETGTDAPPAAPSSTSSAGAAHAAAGQLFGGSLLSLVMSFFL